MLAIYRILRDAKKIFSPLSDILAKLTSSVPYLAGSQLSKYLIFFFPSLALYSVGFFITEAYILCFRPFLSWSFAFITLKTSQSDDGLRCKFSLDLQDPPAQAAHILLHHICPNQSNSMYTSIRDAQHSWLFPGAVLIVFKTELAQRTASVITSSDTDWLVDLKL